MGLTVLTKYTGFLIFPLTALWFLLQRRAFKRKLLPFFSWGVGCLLIAAGLIVTKRMYGETHLIASSLWSLQKFGFVRFLVFLVFLSGVLIVPLVLWITLKWKGWVGGVVLLFGLYLFLSSSIGGFSPSQSILISLWLSTSLILLFHCFRWREWTSKEGVFLLGWFLGFVGMMAFVMGWVAARYFFIAVPAIVFLCVRWVETQVSFLSHKILVGISIVTFAVSAGLAFADYRQAESGRFLVKELKKLDWTGKGRRFYLGESYTMTYALRAGWIPLTGKVVLEKGDVVIVNEVTFPFRWLLRHRKDEFREIYAIPFPTSFPIKIMDVNEGAAFYGSIWGPLPFGLSKGPWERFHVLEVVTPSRRNEP
jgi:hypothetical protein